MDLRIFSSVPSTTYPHTVTIIVNDYTFTKEPIHNPLSKFETMPESRIEVKENSQNSKVKTIFMAQKVNRFEYGIEKKIEQRTSKKLSNL